MGKNQDKAAALAEAERQEAEAVAAEKLAEQERAEAEAAKLAAESVADEAVVVEPSGEAGLYRLQTGYRLYCPTQGRYIEPGEPVDLMEDSWVMAQVEARILTKV